MKTIYDDMNNVEVMKTAKEYVCDLYSNDKKKYDRAVLLAEKLGLFGLWRGVNLTIMHIDKAISKEE